MQFGEVDSYVGHFQQVLDFFTVWVLDWDLRIQCPKDNLPKDIQGTINKAPSMEMLQSHCVFVFLDNSFTVPPTHTLLLHRGYQQLDKMLGRREGRVKKCTCTYNGLDVYCSIANCGNYIAFNS